MTAVPINAVPINAVSINTARITANVASPVRLRITRRGRAVIAVLASLPLLAALVALAAFGGSTAVAGGDTSSQQFEYVTVQSGQDLWSIAESVAPSVDPRDVIAGIVDLNQLQSSAVQAGQRLALPAAYSD